MALSPGLLFLSGWEQILQDSSLSLTCTSNYLPAWSHFAVFLWPHCLHVGHHLKVSTWLPGCTSSFPARALDNLSSLVTQFSLCYQINSPETEVPKAESIAQIKQWPSVHEVPGSAPSTAKKKKKKKMELKQELQRMPPGKPEQQMPLPTYLFCHFGKQNILRRLALNTCYTLTLR